MVLRFFYPVADFATLKHRRDTSATSRKVLSLEAPNSLGSSPGPEVPAFVNPTKVKEFVEQYTTLSPGQSPDQIVSTAYNNYVKQPARSFARAQVEQFDGIQVQNHISTITENLRKALTDQTRNTPFEVLNVVVGNIQYPPIIAEAVARKIASQQELARQETELDIVNKKATQRTAEAQGIAESMAKINGQLSPQYLQYEAIKAQLAMVNSPNHTTIYIPVGAMGVPIVNTISPSPPQK